MTAITKLESRHNGDADETRQSMLQKATEVKRFMSTYKKEEIIGHRMMVRIQMRSSFLEAFLARLAGTHSPECCGGRKSNAYILCNT